MVPFDERISVSAPSPRPIGERIKGEGGRLHAYNELLQETVSGLQGEDWQEFAAEQEPLTLDPLPARAGRGSTHRDHLIKRNQFSRQFCLMRPMLSLLERGGHCTAIGVGRPFVRTRLIAITDGIYRRFHHVRSARSAPERGGFVQ